MVVERAAHAPERAPHGPALAVLDDDPDCLLVAKPPGLAVEAARARWRGDALVPLRPAERVKSCPRPEGVP